MERASYAIALGSNRRHHRYGDPAGVIAAAAAAVSALGSVRAVSPLFRTPALGPAGRSFANAALLLDTDLPPVDLLSVLKRIERDFGRRGGRRWGPRVIDLDIILWSGGAWASAELTIPHAEFRRRRFVLDPLATIVPAWRDPISHLTVRQLHARLTARRPQPK